MKGCVLNSVSNYLKKTICVCVYSSSSGLVQVHACGGQRTILGFFLPLPSILFETGYLCCSLLQTPD